jgi:hypothetical protein
MSETVLDSLLTCPRCGHVKQEHMPTEMWLWFYVCEHCKVVLQPEPGDCCVFCSYGTVPCPRAQQRGTRRR